VEAPRKKSRTWYRTTQAATRDGWPESLNGAALRLADFNLLGDLANEMFAADPSRDGAEVRKASIAAFKAQCEVRRGKWVPVQSYTLGGSGATFPNPRAPQPKIEGT